MKRSFLLLAFALMATSQVVANEYMYTPFVREGVKWVYYYVNEDGFYPADPALEKGKVYMNLEFKGDTCPLAITITQDDWDKAYAGEYSDTITFDIQYTDPPEQQGGGT